MYLSLELVVQIKRKSGTEVQNPHPRSSLGGVHGMRAHDSLTCETWLASEPMTRAHDSLTCETSLADESCLAGESSFAVQWVMGSSHGLADESCLAVQWVMGSSHGLADESCLAGQWDSLTYETCLADESGRVNWHAFGQPSVWDMTPWYERHDVATCETGHHSLECETWLINTPISSNTCKTFLSDMWAHPRKFLRNFLNMKSTRTYIQEFTRKFLFVMSRDVLPEIPVYIDRYRKPMGAHIQKFSKNKSSLGCVDVFSLKLGSLFTLRLYVYTYNLSVNNIWALAIQTCSLYSEGSYSKIHKQNSFPRLAAMFSAREASWRRAFDPCAPLLIILYHYLEQNQNHPRSYQPGPSWLPGSTPSIFQEAFCAALGLRFQKFTRKFLSMMSRHVFFFEIKILVQTVILYVDTHVCIRDLFFPGKFVRMLIYVHTHTDAPNHSYKYIRSRRWSDLTDLDLQIYPISG